MSSNGDPQIRPRTDEERLAYLTGFAQALEIVRVTSLEEARDALRLLAEAEGILEEGEG